MQTDLSLFDFSFLGERIFQLLGIGCTHDFTVVIREDAEVLSFKVVNLKAALLTFHHNYFKILNRGPTRP